MSVWDRLPDKVGSGRGVWEHLAADLKDPPSPEAGLGLWAQISFQPGGLWGEARDETLLLARPGQQQESIWDEANDETLILDREGLRSVWEAAQVQADEAPGPDGQQGDLWDELRDETLILARPDRETWAVPNVRHTSRFRPTRAPGWALKRLETAKGEEYHVLKNLKRGTYLKINEQQTYVWNLMDGSHSVEDLAVAIFMEYQTFSYEWLVEWLGELEAGGFLTSEKVDVYQASQQQFRRRNLFYWGKRLVDFLFQSEFSIKGIDQFYTTIYRLGGQLLYSRLALVVLVLVTLAGLPAFFLVTPRDDLLYVLKAGRSLEFGLAGLLISYTIIIFVHESAHALTTKHYGRTVRRGGVGLYFGLLAFFMDTTDIWMERRGPRLAVTWAGPFSGFILGGLASLAILANPTAVWAGPLYQFAAISYVGSALNLNPLLKLDGYYLLMDWLEMPRLRERSISFVRKELLGRLVRREKLSRDERIFSVFGVMALAWTVFFILATVQLYGASVVEMVQGLVAG